VYDNGQFKTYELNGLAFELVVGETLHL